MSAPRSDRPGSARVLAQPPVTSAAVQRISFSPQNGFCSNVTGTFPRTCLGPDECCWHCPAQIGQGVFRKFDIREGFSLFVTDCRIRETWLFEHEESDSSDYLMFGFFLSGHSSSRYETLPESLELRGGQQGIFFFPLNRGMSRVRQESPLRHLSFRLSLELAHFYFGDSLRQAPTALHNAIGHHGRDSFIHVREINQQMEQALSQVLHCPYQGMTRRLFLESRALELLAYQLEQLPPAIGATQDTPALHPQDRERTELARELLLRDLEHPPGLGELARAAGMSHPKLNRCFKSLYGMTAFHVLRQERLHRARHLLEDRRLTVTEAAYSVGYDSLSHFSQAYRKQFGVSPGQTPFSQRAKAAHG